MARAVPDLLIVGAGPAGISAALWAVSLDLKPQVIDLAPQPGGQLHRIHFAPRNLVAAVPGAGAALAARTLAQLAEAGIDVHTRERAVATKRERGVWLVRTDARVFEAPRMVIATGVSRRLLSVPGEYELRGRGVTDSATRDLETLRGKEVTVIGGGDAAFENALILADAGCRVTLAVRGPVHARKAFRERVAAASAIAVRKRFRTLAILGGEAVSGVRFATPDGEIDHPAEAVVVKIGNVPNTRWCRQFAHDEAGYLRVDDTLRVSKAGVWAAGDVVRPAAPGIAVAMGHGALIAGAIRQAVDRAARRRSGPGRRTRARRTPGRRGG